MDRRRIYVAIRYANLRYPLFTFARNSTDGRRAALGSASERAREMRSEISQRGPQRRKRTVKGGSRVGKRAAYLDWAQGNRDSEGIHLVLGARNGSERYLRGQRSPTTSLAMRTYYRHRHSFICLHRTPSLREISRIHERSRSISRRFRERSGDDVET